MAKSHPILIDIGQGLSLMVGLPTVSSWGASERPKNAKKGTLGFNTDTGKLEYFDGKNWLEAQMTEA